MTPPSPPSGPPPTLAEVLSDRVLWWFLALGLYLRLYTLARWPMLLCLRDECTYLALSQRIFGGSAWASAVIGDDAELGSITGVLVAQPPNNKMVVAVIKKTFMIYLSHCARCFNTASLLGFCLSSCCQMAAASLL